MAVPKRKISRQRRDKRRSSVWKLDAPNLVVCPNCKELKMPHQVCDNCGWYDGREVIKENDKAAKEEKADKEEKAAKAEKPAKAEKAKTKAEKPAKAEKTDKPEKAEKAEKSGEDEKAE